MGIVLQVPGIFDDAIAVDALQPARVCAELLLDKAGSSFSRLPVRLISKSGVRFGVGGDHHAVPGGENLVIPQWIGALLPLFEQHLLRLVYGCAKLREFNAATDGNIFFISFAEEDRSTDFRYGLQTVEVEEELRPHAESLDNFCFTPEVILSLHGIRFRVEGGIEPTFVGGHLPFDVAQDILGHHLPAPIPRPRKSSGVSADELRLVVEHLLEVRHEPARIGGIAMEAATDLVVHAAADHRLQGVSDDGLHALIINAANPGIEKKVETHRRWELRRPAKAAVGVIVAVDDGGDGAADERRIRRHRFAALIFLCLPNRLGDLRRRVLHFLPLVLPGVVQRLQHTGKPGPTVAVLWWKVGSGVKRFEVGRQEEGVRPAAAATRQLGRRHVDLIEIGSLLAVHLDIDEPLIHHRRNLGSGEDLALHDVAPVAG